MKLTSQIAKNLRDVYSGDNWTGSNLKDALEGVTWEIATRQVYTFNTIAKLVYHINYYVTAAIKVLEGGPLDSSDKYAFALPPVNSLEDWTKLVDMTWTDVERLAVLIEQLPESKLSEDFSENKYGTYFRNLQGIIEHTHYHLGQIVLIKKIILSDNKN